ncbi:lactonase family protein [Leptospira sp. 'Mane']|uniref:lactonase family protein n=1 Tax=Leptospira sp. 'Mane' TaxID=3387407 RepID=UPI00398ACCF5
MIKKTDNNVIVSPETNRTNISKHILVSCIIISFFANFLLNCKPPILDGACDPQSEGFLISLFLKASQGDPSYSCFNTSASSGENLFTVKYANDFFTLSQNEVFNEIIPISSKPITKCEITPNLPSGLIFDSLTCAIKGTPISGQITKRYTITAYHEEKETKINLDIKVLYIPKFVYAANYTGGNISIYSINPASGALANTFTRTTGGGPNSLAFSPDNRFLAVANRNSQNISIFSVNSLNGDLTPQFTVSVGLMEAIAVAYHPSGSYLYVCTNLNVQTFSANQLTGAITNTDTVTLTGGTSSIAIDPIGKFLYVPLYNASTIAIFKINESNGSLSPTDPPTVSTGIKPISIDMSGNGKTVYVLNETDETVINYKADENTGILRPGSPSTVATEQFPRSLNADPKGRFIYVANEDSYNISVFHINQTNGSLTAAPPIGLATSPNAITVDTSGKFVYTANYSADTISVFTISQETGALTAGTPVGAGSGPTAIITMGTNP